MAAEIFLELEGVEGESETKGFEKKIEVLSYSLGLSNPSNVAYGTGSGAGKVEISSLSIQKALDKATPELFLRCCNGTHFPKGKLTAREAGGKSPVEFFTLEFKQCFVDSVAWGGASGSDKGTESCTFSFEEVTVNYTPQNKDGSAGSKITQAWNVKSNSQP